MALYEVSRTDYPGPGEFVSARVIAHGAAQARARVAHLSGVTKDNVCAVSVDVSSRDLEPRLLSAYFDESPTLPEAADGASLEHEAF